MRMLSFANRNRKEILRDPLSLIFGIGFPLILLLLMTWLKKSLPDMPTELFALSAFAPGMVMFGQSFISMFLGILMAGDRSGSFLMRLFASPMRCIDYIGGYALPLIPIAAAQSALCFTAAVLLGLPVSVHILPAFLLSVLNSLLFIALGLLIGSVLQNSQQVGGIGSVLVNVAAWLSGVWFPLDQIGCLQGTSLLSCCGICFSCTGRRLRRSLASSAGSSFIYDAFCRCSRIFILQKDAAVNGYLTSIDISVNPRQMPGVY